MNAETTVDIFSDLMLVPNFQTTLYCTYVPNNVNDEVNTKTADIVDILSGAADVRVLNFCR